MKTARKKRPAAIAPAATVIVHGAQQLNAVSIDSYNLEIKDRNGFLGDRANKKTLAVLVERWRTLLDAEEDCLGGKLGKDITKHDLDAALSANTFIAQGLAQSVAEDFAQALAYVIARFLKAPGWKGTQRIVFGGGIRATRLGERSVARAAFLLREKGIRIDLQLIANDPDDAGLIGAAHLAPGWMFQGFDGLLAIDIGGSNMRAGIVAAPMGKDDSLRKAYVWRREIWKHKLDSPSRTAAIEELAHMLARLIKSARRKRFRLAPFVGIGCPGIITPDGTIARGAQNLPGNWSGGGFNLPSAIGALVAKLAGFAPTVVMHNDAVVQGLSEIPRMTDVSKWAVLTIGTGLGNARFTNTKAKPRKS